MELVVSGWRRNHGPRTIIERDIESATLSNGLSHVYDWHEAAIKFIPPTWESDPSIQIYAGAELTKLNGDYLVELRLRKSEVARLFAICFQDDPLSKVIKSLEQVAEHPASTR